MSDLSLYHYGVPGMKWYQHLKARQRRKRREREARERFDTEINAYKSAIDKGKAAVSSAAFGSYYKKLRKSDVSKGRALATAAILPIAFLTVEALSSYAEKQQAQQKQDDQNS